MGRYSAKKRQVAKKKPERKAVEYRTTAGRTKNRVAVKAPATTSTIPASKRPADMQKGKIYGDKTAATGRNWTNGHGAKSSKPSTGDHTSARKKAPPAPKLPPKLPPKQQSSGKSTVDKEIAGAKTFIATYKGKKGKEGMQAAVKKMEAKLAKLRKKKGLGKSDLKIPSNMA